VDADRPGARRDEERDAGPGSGPRARRHQGGDAECDAEHEDRDADRRSNTGSDAGPERRGVDPARLVGEAKDRDRIALDPVDDAPEAEPPQIRVARRHGGLDPVELAPDLG
jgi:hypothetical protein